jgi:hypothetical protein
MLLFLLACDLPRDVPALSQRRHRRQLVAEARADTRPREAYPEALARLDLRRQDLARRHRAGEEVLDEARSAVLESVSEDIFPAWYGTEWDFYGTSQTPGQGQIACGYFVSTVLRDAGFEVERVRLAQQASENIIKSLVPSEAIRRYSRESVDGVLDEIEEQGDGLYLVGLDYHVAFVLREGERLDMCHSSVLDPGAVVCEPARSAPAMSSGYHVTGQLLQEPMLEAWLGGASIATVGTVTE